jgi:hypothetical protein
MALYKLDKVIEELELKKKWKIEGLSVRSKLYHARKKYHELVASKNNNGTDKYETWAIYTALGLSVPIKSRKRINYGVKGKRRNL